MPGRKILKYLSLLLLLTLFFVKSEAQPYSYILIQADKGIEFSVKANKQSLPQYGKTYAIIPKLPAGTVKVYILFPKKDYPPQRFVIEVPEKGFRDFLLTNYEGSISLYDIQTLSYQRGETITEQQIAADFYEKPITPAPEKILWTDSAGILTDISDSSLILKKPVKEVVAPITKEIMDTAGLADYNNNPVNKTKYYDPKIRKEEAKDADTSSLNDYYNNPVNKANLKRPAAAFDNNTKKRTELYQDASKKAKTSVGSPPVADPVSLTDYRALHPSEKTDVSNNNKNKAANIVKVKCGEPIASKAYDDIYVKALQKSDKERLKFLAANLRNCFSSGQVRVLATTLSTDPERYAFLKQAYPHVTDKGNFAALESILTKQEWKDYFELLLQ